MMAAIKRRLGVPFTVCAAAVVRGLDTENLPVIRLKPEGFAICVFEQETVSHGIKNAKSDRILQ